MAISWLNGVMAEAKRVGLTVNMSYKLREYGMDYAFATSKVILEEYPLPDGLELISEEDIGTFIDQIRNNTKCSEGLKEPFKERKIQLTNGKIDRHKKFNIKWEIPDEMSTNSNTNRNEYLFRANYIRPLKNK
jgi:hypothetical protein